jgi:nucleotide-binding universal stress UspA family protein
MKILLAVDGSPYSDAAVNEVVSRPWPEGSIVRLVAAVQPYTPPATEIVMAGATMEEVRRQQTTEATQLTSRVADVLRKGGLEIETAIRDGDPRSAIVDEASDWGADLIVMGSHGRTGLKRWLLGSVAGSVVSHAPCSVEVVRRPVDQR